MIEIKIKGLSKLSKQLIQLGEADITKAMKLSALSVEKTAKELCPVDTGLLHNSITSNVEMRGIGNGVAIVGTSVEYAANVELGLGQRAQPYLEPALMLNKDKIRRRLTNAVLKQAKAKFGAEE